MIPRILAESAAPIFTKYPVMTVTGSRQSGKTPLARAIFADKPYANLENPVTRQFAQEDPLAILNQYPEGAVIDEIQRVPLRWNPQDEVQVLDLYRDSIQRVDLDVLNALGRIEQGGNDILLLSEVERRKISRVWRLADQFARCDKYVFVTTVSTCGSRPSSRYTSMRSVFLTVPTVLRRRGQKTCFPTSAENLCICMLAHPLLSEMSRS